MSLVASYLSGITLLSTPTEIYTFGTQYAYILGGPLVMGIFFHLVMIPVFYELKIVSMYEVSRVKNIENAKIASRKMIIYLVHAPELDSHSLCNHNSTDSDNSICRDVLIRTYGCLARSRKSFRRCCIFLFVSTYLHSRSMLL